MPTVIQINTYDGGSTGTIARNINEKAKQNGWSAYLFYGRDSYHKAKHQGEALIGNNIWSRIRTLYHVLSTRLFDKHGLASNRDTEHLIKEIKRIKPDIIHLHNIHGYYMNYKILFEYLKESSIPVIWTLHDCWAMTGHCVHFNTVNCNKWEKQCQHCPQVKTYPTSLCIDRSAKNFTEKKRVFNSINRLTLVPVSNWLGDLVKKSFLKNHDITVIHNGIDVNTFKFTQGNIKELYNISDKKIVLGVATPWSKRKGFDDFIKLYETIPQDKYQIVMIGLSDDLIKKLPDGIIGLPRTNNVELLVKWYSAADVFVNMTYEDNYPTTNMEAISCGTPVITYKTGGSPESITLDTGRVVAAGNIAGAAEAIEEICSLDRDTVRDKCKKHAIAYFDKDTCFQKYLELYEKVINNKYN